MLSLLYLLNHLRTSALLSLTEGPSDGHLGDESARRSVSLDKLTREQRSANMRAVKSKNTAPEILARRAAHRMGLRFRIHRHDLPGCPDIVLPKYHTVVFVHGCFWHGHRGCSRAVLPKSNPKF